MNNVPPMAPSVNPVQPAPIQPTIPMQNQPGAMYVPMPPTQPNLQPMNIQNLQEIPPAPEFDNGGTYSLQTIKTGHQIRMLYGTAAYFSCLVLLLSLETSKWYAIRWIGNESSSNLPASLKKTRRSIIPLHLLWSSPSFLSSSPSPCWWYSNPLLPTIHLVCVDKLLPWPEHTSRLLVGCCSRHDHSLLLLCLTLHHCTHILYNNMMYMMFSFITIHFGGPWILDLLLYVCKPRFWYLDAWYHVHCCCRLPTSRLYFHDPSENVPQWYSLLYSVRCLAITRTKELQKLFARNTLYYDIHRRRRHSF